MIDGAKANLNRMSGWWVISALAFLGILYLAPQQFGVLLFKTLLVTFGTGLAYTVDRELFKYVTPVDQVDHDVFGAARILARALIVLAVLLALSLGI